MGRKRGRGNFGGQSEQENTLNQLLVEMDGEQLPVWVRLSFRLSQSLSENPYVTQTLKSKRTPTH